jgi:hypothetical protein
MTRPAVATTSVVLSWRPITIRVGPASAHLLTAAARWYGDHFATTLTDEVDPADHDVTGVADDGSPDAVTLLVRRIRAVSSAALYEHGWVPLHAAAVVDARGRALVLFGPSGSGKTTILLSLLRAGAGALLANDRVFVCDGQARGLPVSIGVRPDTARRFLPHPAGGQHVDGRLHLPPRELAGVFRAGTARTGTVSALVRIRFDPRASGCALRRVHQAEADALLTESRLDHDPAWAAEWLGTVRREIPVPVAPTYELVLGPSATDRATDQLRGLF